VVSLLLPPLRPSRAAGVLGAGCCWLMGGTNIAILFHLLDEEAHDET
jgi:hypothetical protein